MAIIGIVAIVLAFMSSDKSSRSCMENPGAGYKAEPDLVGGATNALAKQPTLKFAKAALHLGGVDYRVISSSDITKKDFAIFVDMDGDGIVGDSSAALADKESDIISINNQPYFFLKDYGVLQYYGSDEGDNDNPALRFKNMQTNDVIELAYSIDVLERVLCNRQSS